MGGEKSHNHTAPHYPLLQSTAYISLPFALYFATLWSTAGLDNTLHRTWSYCTVRTVHAPALALNCTAPCWTVIIYIALHNFSTCTPLHLMRGALHWFWCKEHCTAAAANAGCVDSADKKAPTAQNLHNSAADFYSLIVSIFVHNYYYYAKYTRRQSSNCQSQTTRIWIYLVWYTAILFGRIKQGEEQFSLQYLKPETIGTKEQFVEAVQAPQHSTRLPSDPGRPVWNCSKYLSGGGGGE